MLVIVCPGCGEENPSRFRLCGYCGASLVAELPAQELRKVVTIVFSDLKGSTMLGEALDPEAVREVEARYFEAMRGPLLQHGGTLEKYIGDAIMAVFGFPKVREDDALRAVRAAHGMQLALTELNVELELEYGVTLANRTGVNTGPVVANADPNANQQIVTGDTVNVAARLEQAAPAMEVLIGELTYQLVRDQVSVETVEPLELKGKAERVPAYRLLDVRGTRARTDETDVRGAPTPFVGRVVELASLSEALDEVEEFRTCQLRVIVGDAGVGKSRLAREFRQRLGDRARVVRGRCLPYGEGITFWPVVEMVREAAAIEPEDAPQAAIAKISAVVGADGTHGTDEDAVVERVASTVGLTPTRFPVAELFWGIRKFLESLTRTRPLVMVIDDLHSAEPTFLELLDHLVETVRGAPILVVGAARLELQEAHAGWWDAQAANRLQTRPLGPVESGQLIGSLLGDGGLDPVVSERIIVAAEGNPLFAEQVVSMLVDEGSLIRVEDRWVSREMASELAVPPSISALLAARLDHLGREERAVLEPASVIGLIFPTPAVIELVPEMVRSSVNGHLQSLARKRFVRPDASDDEGAYRFANLLVRDTAYGTLLKRSRATLHERFVEWAERINRERGREQEFEEILGYHLEQAYRYRSELGRLDDEGRGIGERGSAKLAAAGRRAFTRGDLPAAVSLLRRASALLPEMSVTRIELFADLAEALISRGLFEEALSVLTEGERVAGILGDARLGARVAVVRLFLDVYAASGDTSASEGIERAREIVRILEPYQDHAGLARAWRLIMANEFTLGDLSGAAGAADRVVEFATLAGDSRLAARSAPAIAYVMVHGPTPVAEGIRQCEELLPSLRGDRKNEALVMSALAQLRAMDGDFETARTLYRRTRDTLIELGGGIEARSTSIESSRVELLAGDLEAAERELRRDDAALAEIDESYFRSTVTGILANVLARAGAWDEAYRYSATAEELADQDDVWSQAAWRTARARVLAARGEKDAAIALARQAVDLASATEDVSLRADILVELAEVLRASGVEHESGPPVREALTLYERKGDRASAASLAKRLPSA